MEREAAVALVPALGAAGLSLAWFAVHLVLGGRDIAGPLRAAEDLGDEVRGGAWLAWHLVSAALVLLAAFFAAGGVLGRPDLIGAGVAMAAAFAAVGLAVPARLGLSYRLLPQGLLFVPLIPLGLWAL